MSLFHNVLAGVTLCRDGRKTTPPLIHFVGQDIKMLKTLAGRFADGMGRPILVDEVTVHNIYRRVVENGQKIQIRFIHGREMPPQGVRLRIQDGLVILNGQEMAEVVVWKKTAPIEFTLECRIKKRTDSMEFRIWNCWQDANGSTQAWIGNAGMVVEDRGNVVTLRCSPGIGEFDPTALEIELNFI